MSWIVRRPLEIDEIILYEREVTRIFSPADLSGLCQYDTRVFPDELLARLVGVHEFRIAIDPGSTTVTRGAVSVVEESAAELVVSGEVDVAVDRYLWSRLEEHLLAEGDVVVDVGEVSFIDVSGCRALVRAATRLRGGRRLVLAHPPRQLVRTLSLCGWADHPRIVLEGGPAPDPVREAASA
jgi:anti-anti-sigma factor